MIYKINVGGKAIEIDITPHNLLQKSMLEGSLDIPEDYQANENDLDFDALVLDSTDDEFEKNVQRFIDIGFFDFGQSE